MSHIVLAYVEREFRCERRNLLNRLAKSKESINAPKIRYVFSPKRLGGEQWLGQPPKAQREHGKESKT